LNYIQAVRDIVKLLSRPSSLIILVFDSKRRCPIPRGTSSFGTENTRGWGKFAIFYWNRWLSRKRYAIGPWLLSFCYGMLIGSDRRRIDPYRFRWPWV